ncbi:MAG: redoxin domain-containing protein [Gammaproteobacteria bacterium]|nr:MAG: redoxin domain-containing protein [Gammaproteobacteria bacterium]
MTQTPSNMLPLGTHAPNFTLPDVVSGKDLCLQDLRGKRATLIMFICNHCPFVIHIQDELVRLGLDLPLRGVSMIAISSNDVENYPEDAPEKMKLQAESLGYNFPYLYDETQDVAKSYDAACTPDFYIFDKELRCAYRGQLDDSRPGNNVPVTGVDIRHALDAITEDKEFNLQQKPSVGCNIKWK